jgi:hypothetical protein
MDLNNITQSKNKQSQQIAFCTTLLMQYSQSNTVVVMEAQGGDSRGRVWLGRVNIREFPCVDGQFCILVVVIVTQLYTQDKISEKYTPKKKEYAETDETQRGVS